MENKNKNMALQVQGESGNHLETVSMSELYDMVFQNHHAVVENLVYAGTYLFVGAPKIGKSFFMAQLAYHVGTGQPLWDYEVHKGTVLYLALEDDNRRLQQRLFKMFDVKTIDCLHFSTASLQLSCGLEEQLTNFVNEHKDTRLIIIDTLQKIREVNGEKFSYANDYDVVSRLKKFADTYSVCLILVHHTRKQQSDDQFDMISGTNGLLGSADGALILHKDKRTSNQAILEISGRDQQDQRIYLKRDEERLIWQFQKAETELWKEPPDPILIAIKNFITVDNSNWCGTPTELAEILSIDVQPNALSMILNVRAGLLLDEYSILYEKGRNHKGRFIKLSLQKKEA